MFINHRSPIVSLSIDMTYILKEDEKTRVSFQYKRSDRTSIHLSTLVQDKSLTLVFTMHDKTSGQSIFGGHQGDVRFTSTVTPVSDTASVSTFLGLLDLMTYSFSTRRLVLWVDPVFHLKIISLSIFLSEYYTILRVLSSIKTTEFRRRT